MENIPLTQQRAHRPIKKNEVRDNRKNSARDRSAEFGGANQKKKQ